MATSEMLIRDYYSKNQDRIIDCPFQVGNLKISENACLKRHEVAKSKSIKSSELEDTFKYFFSQGLLRCEQCPIIKDLLPKSDNTTST
jgi:hypothetical protein